MIKRGLDLLASLLGLIVLSPMFLATAVAIKLDSKGPVFFRQERMGKGFKRFHIYKFRTMVDGADRLGSQITAGNDPRITRVGRILRRFKLDEFPQLINVIKGEMSLVGPRPEVPKYVELFRNDYEEILKIRPGITDLASVKYRDEERLIGTFSDPEEAYVKEILPDKIRLAKEYSQASSFLVDMQLIIRTISNLRE